jgi:hypothetical protein
MRSLPNLSWAFLKKRSDDLEIVASTNEGGWDWRVIPFLNNSRGKPP